MLATYGILERMSSVKDGLIVFIHCIIINFKRNFSLVVHKYKFLYCNIIICILSWDIVTIAYATITTVKGTLVRIIIRQLVNYHTCLRAINAITFLTIILPGQ